MQVKGIHHISNIVGHPQNNIDYATSFLGLRMIKKAVNFDDAFTYHFYYGNNDADIGSIVTAFPYVGDIKEGIKGGGQVNSIYYIIPEGSFSFWERRLKEFNIDYKIIERFSKRHLVFSDEVGITNELVESKSGHVNHYEYNGITKKEAIKGFYGALIYSRKPQETKDFFTNVLRIKLEKEDLTTYRFAFTSEIGNYLDLSKLAYSRGRNSKGTVHHIALTVENLEVLKAFEKKIKSLGLRISDIKNRDFFHALYFIEPGGTLIELSTVDPGLASEEIDELGLNLYLPEHFTDKRKQIEETLVPVHVKPVKSLKAYKYATKSEHDMFYYHQNLLKRINELASLAKQRSLTEEEVIERKDLREKYLKNIRNSFSSLVETIKIEAEDGKLYKVERKKEKWGN